jgi:(p)ppGpp synthase/HD superfamily hydrolase
VLTPRFADAFAYGLDAHAGQTKKGTTVPYIAHLMDVTALVLMHGGNEDEAVAALLHDAAEDAGGRPRLNDIRQRFGDAVAEIVEGCSDTLETTKPPWLQRKTAYIEHLPQVSASTRLVSAADKAANVRTIVADFKAIGEEVFERFAGRKHGTLWYYRTLADIFLRLGPVALARQLDETVRELQRLTGMEGDIARPDPISRT